MAAEYDGNGTHFDLDRCVIATAERQCGVFTRTQAVRCGATDGRIRWRLRMKRWQQMHPGVFRLPGSPLTWRQLAVAACLYCGPRAALSHRTASTFLGLRKLRSEKMEVTVGRNRSRLRSRTVKIYRPRTPIPDEDVTLIDGVWVTRPARTLLDLATVEPEEVVEECLDDALRRKLVSLPFLERWLSDPRRKRHPGARLLRRLVDERAVVGVTDSPLETRLLILIRKAGLPPPMLQYVVRDADRFVARLDFAYPDERVGVEVDGFRYHDRRRQFDTERARGNELEALGWRVLRITAKHIEEDPDTVVEWVRRSLSVRP